jgi:mannose/fructose-specific phosphotransferase system component IIA
VIGDFSHCHAVSNTSKTPQGLADEVQALVDSADEDGCIIFVDFLGGSCSHACLRIESEPDTVSIICGANLPMLLAFLNKREEIPFAKLAAEIVKRSLGSIKSLDPSEI